MRIALVGAGGVGAAFGAFLARAGHDLVAVARGEHLAAIRRDGLAVERDSVVEHLRVLASDDARDLGEADVVLFAVKLWGTEAAGAAARPLVGPETLVLSLQNGVDALERLSPILGARQVVAGVSQVSAVIVAPGRVLHRSPFARIIAGRPGGAADPVLERFVAACVAAGIEARASGTIELDLWAKFAFIAALSGACCLFRSDIGRILADRETREVYVHLIAEAVAVGRAEGVALPADQVERTLALTATMPPAMRASMLDDLERGQRLELPWLTGRVIAGGRTHGVATPASDAVALALRLHVAGG